MSFFGYLLLKKSKNKIFIIQYTRRVHTYDDTIHMYIHTYIVTIPQSLTSYTSLTNHTNNRAQKPYTSVWFHASFYKNKNLKKKPSEIAKLCFKTTTTNILYELCPSHPPHTLKPILYSHPKHILYIIA